MTIPVADEYPGTHDIIAVRGFCIIYENIQYISNVDLPPSRQHILFVLLCVKNKYIFLFFVLSVIIALLVVKN